MSDYGLGVLLIVAPWLFGFAAGGIETWLPVLLGIGVLGYSLCTDYELSLVRAIGMPAHLMLDAGGGILLAISPWLFGFADYVWAPRLIIGLLEIGGSMITKTEPTHRHQPTHYGV